ncbi:hypothetical protein OSB04_005346 [Centaurea solstitialis]|uniref:Uncharacterized protein n=1 Tax=Centaurea solstitialis TaxID=347529 RepID=A0AA38TRE3_9ASTR|nr:hypothetical protein OSB04_005346 [Centaurea solstitialis]
MELEKNNSSWTRAKLIDSASNSLCSNLPEWRTIGKFRVHYWRILLDRLPTLDNLVKRGINVGHILSHLEDEEWHDFHRRYANPVTTANEVQSIVFSWVCNRSVFGKSRSWTDGSAIRFVYLPVLN